MAEQEHIYGNGVQVLQPSVCELDGQCPSNADIRNLHAHPVNGGVRADHRLHPRPKRPQCRLAGLQGLCLQDPRGHIRPGKAPVWQMKLVLVPTL